MIRSRRCQEIRLFTACLISTDNARWVEYKLRSVVQFEGWTTWSVVNIFDLGNTEKTVFII